VNSKLSFSDIHDDGVRYAGAWFALRRDLPGASGVVLQPGVDALTSFKCVPRRTAVRSLSIVCQTCQSAKSLLRTAS
jgi:hypothetical protein